MEHGADLKHGVQPSEPSRGTGMLNYDACVASSRSCALACTQFAQWGCTLLRTALRCLAYMRDIYTCRHHGPERKLLCA